MAKNNWDKELNNIGKQMNQIQKEEVNRKDLYWAFGLLAVALAFLLRILEESVLLPSIIAGVLTGISLVKLKKSTPSADAGGGLCGCSICSCNDSMF